MLSIILVIIGIIGFFISPIIGIIIIIFYGLFRNPYK